MQTEPVYRTVYTRWARAPASQSCFGKHGCKRPVDKHAKQTVVHTRFSSHSFTQKKSRHPLLWQAARVVRGSSYLQSVCRAGHPRVIHFTKRLLRGSSAGHPIYKAFAARVIRGSSYLQSVCCAGHPRVILFTKRLLRGSPAGHPIYKAFAARVIRGSSAGHPFYKAFAARVIRGSSRVMRGSSYLQGVYRAGHPLTPFGF